MPHLPLVTALGCAVTLDPGEDRTPADLEVVRAAWSGARTSAADALPAHHVTVAVPGGPLEVAIARLSPAVTLAAIDARRGDLWMLHAGAVADDRGRVVAVVGPSGRGKTTATRALARVYGYVTDETVGVDADGGVTPYRKPLSVIVDPLREKEQLSPAELGLRPLPDAPLRLSAVVLLDRQPGFDGEPRLTACELGEALPELVEQTSYLAALPAPLRTVAAHLAAVGGVHRVTYGEADTLPDALAPLFRDAAPIVERAPAGRDAGRDVGRDANADAAATGGSRWFRSAHLDAIDLPGAGPDRLALLQAEPSGGATLRILDGIAPTLWRCAAGTDLAALTDAVVAAHGAPPERTGSEAVRDAVDALAAAGVLATAPSVRVRDDVAWTGEGDHFVALALSRSGSPEPVALEANAGEIWRAVTASRGATASVIAQRVAASLGEDPALIEPDVTAFLDSLETRSLVESYLP